MTLADFHVASADRAARWPHTMLATSTHDNKRSEDVRNRIDVLSEMPATWRLALRRWRAMNRVCEPLADDVEGDVEVGVGDGIDHGRRVVRQRGQLGARCSADALPPAAHCHRGGETRGQETSGDAERADWRARRVVGRLRDFPRFGTVVRRGRRRGRDHSLVRHCRGRGG